jgi:hypothetical protein
MVQKISNNIIEQDRNVLTSLKYDQSINLFHFNEVKAKEIGP